MLEPLLSICIPTYNRAELLSYSLAQMIIETTKFKDKIEIIISDNNSTDNTKAIVNKFKENNKILKYYKNDENIGFNYNIFKIIDKYATGKFCWIIGDDDFIYNNSISSLISVLQNQENIDFIYTNYDLIEIEKNRNIFFKDKIFNRLSNFDNPIGYSCSFDDILTKEFRSSNILLTFISTTIFRKNLITSLEKTEIKKESWTNFQSLFPHSYFYAKIMKGRHSYFFETPLIFASIHEKSWDDKLPLLYLKFIPELFDFYTRNGYSREILKKTHESIVLSTITFLFRQNNSGKLNSFQLKINFLKHNFLSAYFYKAIYLVAVKKMKLVLIN